MTTRILGPQPGPGNGDLLAAALAYAKRGWSIIFVKGKKAVGGWKHLQKKAAAPAALRTMFARPGVTGLAVILGGASGGLAVRDFDRAEAYEAWAAAYPDFAARLPTVRTARGFHVYFRVTEEVFQTFNDASGELRGDSKHIVVLPPSRHPDGAVYCWVIPLPDGELPFFDPLQAGLCNTEDRENTEDRVDTVNPANPAPSSLLVSATFSAPSVLQEIERAFSETLPTTQGQRNRRVFRLARYLKSIPSLRSADFETLRPIVKQWHERAMPFIGTQPFLDTWADFVQAWKRVRLPAGDGVIETAFARAVTSAAPQRATELYGDGPIVLLAAFCRELQAIAGDREFFLDCRTAGLKIGVDHTTAWRYFEVLCVDGILAPGPKGSQATRKASRFRYLE